MDYFKVFEILQQKKNGQRPTWQLTFCCASEKSGLMLFLGGGCADKLFKKIDAFTAEPKLRAGNAAN